MPTPMPAPNIIENQAKRLNSGWVSGEPSFCRPVLGSTAINRHRAMNAVVTQTYQAPKRPIVAACTVSSISAASLVVAAHSTSTTMISFTDTAIPRL